MTLGERIRYLRTEKKISQKELGDKCHVKQATISSWEKDRTEPNMANLKDISDILHVDLPILIYGEDEGNKIMKLANKTYWNIKLNEIIMDFTDEQMEKLCDYAELLALKK